MQGPCPSPSSRILGRTGQIHRLSYRVEGAVRIGALLSEESRETSTSLPDQMAAMEEKWQRQVWKKGRPKFQKADRRGGLRQWHQELQASSQDPGSLSTHTKGRSVSGRGGQAGHWRTAYAADGTRDHWMWPHLSGSDWTKSPSIVWTWTWDRWVKGEEINYSSTETVSMLLI